MSKEKRPSITDKHRNKIIASTLVILTVSILLIASVQSPKAIPTATGKAQFVISSWNFPDEYGQGIEAFEIYENSTGFWVLISGAYGYEDTGNIEIYDNASIKLRCYTWFNSTFMDVTTTNEGKNLQQHSVVVIGALSIWEQSVIVFSQQNFTWFYDDDSIDPPMWYYGYEVVLNFIPQQGQIYTTTVIYEIWY